MKIILAEHFGMCFGVRDAIAHAEALAGAGPLTILGELAHNPLVRERLRTKGVQEGSLDGTVAGMAPAVMITAHGASDFRRSQWQTAGYRVTDGTCPLVRRAHSELRALVKAGFFPVVIGQAGHVEVRGLTEDFPGAVIVSATSDVRQLPFVARYGVISQTTQPIDRVRALVAEIQRAFPEAGVRFVDTVCKPTKDRQLALRELIVATDLIVVVGGRGSNNTRQLVETAEAAGGRALHIERAEELVAADFTSGQIVGLTAGTSTLPETVRAVHGRLLEIARTYA